MDIQNVVIDFTSNKIKSLYENKQYTNLSISNIGNLSSALDDAFEEAVTNMVVQYTKDQYGSSEARILVNDSTQTKSLADISSDYAELNSELATMKQEIENEIIE